MNLPKVSIVITTYFNEAKEYRDACMKSVAALNYPKELLDIVLVAPTWVTDQYEGVKTVNPACGAYYNCVAVNYGFKVTNQDSKYVLMLNDDVILTKNSLIKMVHYAGDNHAIIGTVSNCDNQDFYTADLPLGLNDRQLRMENIRDKIDAMIDADLPTGPVRFIHPRTLYLYANLYPRSIWNSIKGGTTPDDIGFDESYKLGFDDTDYIMRCQQAGIRLVIPTDILAWHCSGVTADTTMKDLNSDLRKENEAFFRKKWNL